MLDSSFTKYTNPFFVYHIFISVWLRGSTPLSIADNTSLSRTVVTSMSRSQRLKEEQKPFLVLTTGFNFGIKIKNNISFIPQPLPTVLTIYLIYKGT